MATRLKLNDLKKLDYDRIMEMYKQQFRNPGSFVFTFVGNVDEAKVRPVVEQYLASLPGQAVKGEFIKVPMEYKKGKSNNVFTREMQNPKASVFNSITGKTDRVMKNWVMMSMLDQILDIVYTEKVREDEGGTYGVGTGGGIMRYPDGQTVLQISFDTDPAKMEHLNGIILKELNNIAENGPRTEDFNKVKEYMNKSYTENQRENGYWVGILDSKYFYGEDTHTEHLKTVNSITPKDIQNFTKQLLDQGNVATVVMMPKE